MTADELITRIRAGNFTAEEVIQAAGNVSAADAKTAAAGRRVVFAALGYYTGKADEVAALLESIAQRYAGDSAIVQFTREARAAYDKIMEAVYQKIINPRSGTPCCPKCGSPNIAEVGGAFEFAEMRCFDCGESEYCDPYQVGDWYR